MISIDEYLRVQEIINQRAKPRRAKIDQSQINKNSLNANTLNDDIIFRGVFKCQNCGGMITASKIYKEQKNGNKHEYIYYHCGKKVDKTCEQKSRSLSQSELEKQIIAILEHLSIPPDLCTWLMEQLQEKNEFKKEVQEQALKERESNLQKEINRINTLIDMRANHEITAEEYAQKRQEAEEKKTCLETQINQVINQDNELLISAEKTLSFATNLKNRFKNSSPEDKRNITLSLGSNPEIFNRKAHFYLDFKLQPLEKYAQGAISEFERVEPLEMPMNTTQNTSVRGACSVMSGQWDVIGTEIEANITSNS